MMYGLLAGLSFACLTLYCRNLIIEPLDTRMTDRSWDTVAKGNIMRATIRMITLPLGTAALGGLIGLIIRGS